MTASYGVVIGQSGGLVASLLRDDHGSAIVLAQRDPLCRQCAKPELVALHALRQMKVGAGVCVCPPQLLLTHQAMEAVAQRCDVGALLQARQFAVHAQLALLHRANLASMRLGNSKC